MATSYSSLKTYKLLVTALFAFIIATGAFAQTNLEMGNDAYNAKEYTEALAYYQKVLKKPYKGVDVPEVKFKVAESLRYTGKYEEAIAAYDDAKAAGYTNPNYLYHQGTIYLKQGNYESAKKKFEAFLEAVPGDKDATRLLNNAKFATSTVEDKSVYTFKIESALNSAYNDYAPFMVKDKLIFTSSRLEDKGQEVYTYDGQGFSSLYTSTYVKDNKSWSTPAKATALATEFNDGVLTYCDKTKTAYYTRCNDNKSKTVQCGIVESTYDETAGTWSAPKPITLALAQKGDMEQPAISADGEVLYFVSRMEGGQGGTDIWMMRKSGSQWGEPQNLGGTVNTEFDEMFPVENNGMLYFSSEGFTGYGALDLFSTTNTNGSWSKPTNLRAQFNSSADDFFITFAKDGSGYFTSNRKGGSGGDDIYSFFVTPVTLTVKGRITDQDGGAGIAGAKVYLTTADGIDSTLTDANGEYTFTLDKDKDYKINVSNPGYFGDSRKLTTQGEKFSKEFSKATGYNYDFAIKKIPKTEIKIDNIYYDYDSYTLREESKPSLDILVKLLEDTPGALVQINSHTDERGKQPYNQKLSEDRAKSVVDYLVSKGISQGRLSWKGFGFAQPVIKGAKTEEEHQQNRRTAFQVINND